eukprot:365125-Chlamydomonas_euryale.AAC.13
MPCYRRCMYLSAALEQCVKYTYGNHSVWYHTGAGGASSSRPQLGTIQGGGNGSRPQLGAGRLKLQDESLKGFQEVKAAASQRVTGGGPTKGVPVLSAAGQEGINQQAGRCDEGNTHVRDTVSGACMGRS